MIDIECAYPLWYKDVWMKPACNTARVLKTQKAPDHRESCQVIREKSSHTFPVINFLCGCW